MPQTQTLDVLEWETLDEFRRRITPFDPEAEPFEFLRDRTGVRIGNAVERRIVRMA